jgi:hypothetical protein
MAPDLVLFLERRRSHVRASTFERLAPILNTFGKEAYVEAISAGFGPRIARSGDLRLFRHLRRAYAGVHNVELDRLSVREIATCSLPTCSESS